MIRVVLRRLPFHRPLRVLTTCLHCGGCDVSVCFLDVNLTLSDSDCADLPTIY